MNKKIIIGLSATAAFTYLSYSGIHSFVDVIYGVSNLGDAISELENYITNNSVQSLEQAKELITQAREYLTSHLHIFPLSPNANGLDEVVNNLNSTELSQEVIPYIKKVKNAYSWSGNCLFVKLLIPPFFSFISGRYTFNKIRDMRKEN